MALPVCVWACFLNTSRKHKNLHPGLYQLQSSGQQKQAGHILILCLRRSRESVPNLCNADSYGSLSVCSHHKHFIRTKAVSLDIPALHLCAARCVLFIWNWAVKRCSGPGRRGVRLLPGLWWATVTAERPHQHPPHPNPPKPSHPQPKTPWNHPKSSNRRLWCGLLFLSASGFIILCLSFLEMCHVFGIKDLV